MLVPSQFIELLREQGVNFFTGVPDSQLKEFCECLMNKVGICGNHIIAPNEGNAVALAAGHYLSTGNIGLVYMQNSGLGNAVNPITSLIDPKVYAIPVVFLIGWRGMPGVHDEPQHIKQGEITLGLLDILGIDYMRIGKASTCAEVNKAFSEKFAAQLQQGKSVAIVVEKGGFQPEIEYRHKVEYSLSRERAIEIILGRIATTAAVISTTGKISREVYEQRELHQSGHPNDFLTVGSMGHASMIALKIAENQPQRQIWCLDGDGAVLMHTGALALIGARKPANYYHVILNNLVHESVGGLPTVADSVDFPSMARACGYRAALTISDENNLLESLSTISQQEGPILLEVAVSNGARNNLGRPHSSPIENKQAFMQFLKEE